MTAQPVTPGRARGGPSRAPRWTEPQPPFTVDTLFELPDSNLRYQVLEGQLIVSPAPTPAHNLAADRIGRLIIPLLPLHCDAITNTAVRMPSGDGPVPDLLVTSGDTLAHERGLPSGLVHSVIEVVSPSNASDDRVKKAGIYAAGGIPCYWRVELRSWREHFGPVPAIVVRLLTEDGNVQEHLYAAGETHNIPLAIGPGPDFITVPMDPAVLIGPRRL